MKKYALRESVQHALLQHDKTNKYDDRVVDSFITMATNTIMGQLFRRDHSNYDLYAKTFDTTIEKDESDIYYSIYPAPIVQTIEVRNGVRRINTSKNTGLEFAPVRGDEISLIEGLDVTMLSDIIPYVPERDRVRYMGNLSQHEGKTVRMDLVVPFSEYEDNDEYYIPGGSDLEVIEVVFQILQQIPLRDKLNNERDPHGSSN